MDPDGALYCVVARNDREPIVADLDVIPAGYASSGDPAHPRQ